MYIVSGCDHELIITWFVCELLNSEYYIAVLEEEERYYTVSWTLDTESIVFLQYERDTDTLH